MLTSFPVVLLFLLYSLLGRAEGLRCLGNASTKSNIDTLYTREHCHHCTSLQVTITVVMLYHNECASLRFLTRSWKMLPSATREQTRLLVIDDNADIPACHCVDRSQSGEGSAASLQAAGITLVRIQDSRPWNIGGARNLGAFLSCSPFLFVADMDALITEPLLSSALFLTRLPGAESRLHQFNRHLVPPSSVLGEDWIRNFNIVNTTVTLNNTKFHPGMMLVGRDAYWANHGCDEDFVGHYGQTDPHFRHNFATRPGNSIHQHAGLFMCRLRSPFDDSLQRFLPAMSRDTAPNKRLLRLKLKRRIPWNHTVLRFHWVDSTFVCDSERDSPVTGSKSEGRAYVRSSVMMQTPMSAEHAFSTHSWGKTFNISNSASCSRKGVSIVNRPLNIE